MEQRSGRWAALDNLRGLTVFLMIPVNAGMDFTSIPAWFKHAPGQGLTLADFIMPAFLCALGTSASFSFRRRLAEKGIGRTILHALRRYGLLFLFGTIGFIAVWGSRNWEILQMLGLSGALAFPFLFLPPAWRAAAAVALVGGVEALRPVVFDAAFRAWYEGGIGGPAGAIPLAAIPIAASALGEFLQVRSWKGRAGVAAIVGAVCLGAGLGAGALRAHAARCPAWRPASAAGRPGEKSAACLHPRRDPDARIARLGSRGHSGSLGMRAEPGCPGCRDGRHAGAGLQKDLDPALSRENREQGRKGVPVSGLRRAACAGRAP